MVLALILTILGALLSFIDKFKKDSLAKAIKTNLIAFATFLITSIGGIMAYDNSRKSEFKSIEENNLRKKSDTLAEIRGKKLDMQYLTIDSLQYLNSKLLAFSNSSIMKINSISSANLKYSNYIFKSSIETQNYNDGKGTFCYIRLIPFYRDNYSLDTCTYFLIGKGAYPLNNLTIRIRDQKNQTIYGNNIGITSGAANAKILSLTRLNPLGGYESFSRNDEPGNRMDIWYKFDNVVGARLDFNFETTKGYWFEHYQAILHNGHWLEAVTVKTGGDILIFKKIDAGFPANLLDNF